MKYMGSKARISKHILPIILEHLKPEQHFVELFCGGCNLTDKVDHQLIIANDINSSLIALWRTLQQGWIPPKWISREQYTDIKENQYAFDPELVGWACFCCSYSGKPFSGFAGEHVPDTGVLRNYQTETYNYVLKQIKKLQSVVFTNLPYDEVDIPDGSIIYADPPYKGTTGYKVKFDHERFYSWSRTKQNLFISEYWMPNDFIEIWSGTLRSSLSANGLYGGSKKTIEKLFIHESQFDNYMKNIL